MQFMRTRIGYPILFLLLLFVVLTTSCSSGDKDNGDSKGTDGIQVQLIKPEGIKSGQKVEYTIKLMQQNQPLKDADVTVSLEMVEMDHGKNGFRGKMTEPGVYKGEATLPMGGDWAAYVKVKVGGTEVTKTFNFTVTGDMLSPDQLNNAGLDSSGAKKNPDF